MQLRFSFVIFLMWDLSFFNKLFTACASFVLGNSPFIRILDYGIRKDIEVVLFRLLDQIMVPSPRLTLLLDSTIDHLMAGLEEKIYIKT